MGGTLKAVDLVVTRTVVHGLQRFGWLHKASSTSGFGMVALHADSSILKPRQGGISIVIYSLSKFKRFVRHLG